MGGLAGNQVGRHDTQWYFHLAEEFRRSELVQEMLEAVVRGHAHARKRPAAEIAEARSGTLAFHFFESSSAGVGGGDQRAHAGPSDEVDRYLVLFKDAQNADVLDPENEAATES